MLLIVVCSRGTCHPESTGVVRAASTRGKGGILSYVHKTQGRRRRSGKGAGRWRARRRSQGSSRLWRIRGLREAGNHLWSASPPPSIGSLLGKRKEPAATSKDPAAAGKNDDEPGEDVYGDVWSIIKWTYHGGRDGSSVPQQQIVCGSVRYDMYSDKRAILLAEGANRTYYVDEDDPSTEVGADHERAMKMQETTGGQLKIHVEGEEHPDWVTCGHVKAVGPLHSTRAASPAKRVRTEAEESVRTSPRKQSTSSSQVCPSGSIAGTSSAEAGGTPSSAAGTAQSETAQTVSRGSGIKAAAKAARKPIKKQPVGARGHAWQPRWLDEHNWLRTTPSRTRAEWEDLPDEAPDNIFCIYCTKFPKSEPTVPDGYRHHVVHVCICHVFFHHASHGAATPATTRVSRRGRDGGSGFSPERAQISREISGILFSSEGPDFQRNF
jgi:hypothetical protein